MTTSKCENFQLIKKYSFLNSVVAVLIPACQVCKCLCLGSHAVFSLMAEAWLGANWLPETSLL
jgi:hypothetical protein